MTDYEDDEPDIDDEGRNPTQRRMDETGESESDEPVDVEWSEEDDTL